MSSQLYTDLIVGELLNASSKTEKEKAFRFPFIGTLSGSYVAVDALPTPIPYSEFEFLVDDKTETKPQYKNGDRLFIAPANDGHQLVIVGRLI